MAAALKVADVTERLADQLQALSEVAETLTFRLLELEERLAAQELKVQPLLEGSASGLGVVAEDTELRLGETEDRLAQLESLLSGLESPGAARHLRSVASPAAHPVVPAHGEAGTEEASTEEAGFEAIASDDAPSDASLGDDSLSDDSLSDAPFLDEAEQSFADESLFAEEQPFLDELTA